MGTAAPNAKSLRAVSLVRNTRVVQLSVPNLTGLEYVLSGEAKIRDRMRFNVLLRNIEVARSARPLNLPPLLRRVVFIGQP